MSKPLSKREQDLARRARAHPQSKDPSKGKRNKILGLAAVAVAAGLIVWAAWPDEPVTTRAGNIAAFQLDDDPFMGDPDAPVVLVGYESPRCSACKQFHNSILPSVIQDYIQTGDVVYHYIQGTIGSDFEMNVAQECAHHVGGNEPFWSMTDAFYARPSTYSQPDLEGMLRDVATEFQLDEQALIDCYQDRDTSAKVSEDWGVGSDHGARGTPSFWIFGPDGEAVRVGAGQVHGALGEAVATAGR